MQAQDTGLLQLACGIMGDLRLNSLSSNQAVPFAVRAFANETARSTSGPSQSRELTKAEKRAFIGVFYVKSMSVFRS